MRWTHPFFSAIQFLQILLLIVGGLICVSLPFAPSLRLALAHAILFKDHLFASLGSVMLVLGVILGVIFYFLQRRPSLQVSMDPPVSVESDVVEALVSQLFQTRFPEYSAKVEAKIDSKGCIDLVAQIDPCSSLNSQQLELLEMEVCMLLKRTLDYQKQITMTVY